MRKQDSRKVPVWTKRGFQTWTLFGVVLAALMCSAVVGTQSVRADGACTAAQCQQAANLADSVCFYHFGLVGVLCPVPGETDDFYFECNDGYSELDDCGTFAPS